MSSSTSAAPPTGEALTWILEHLLNYPGTYELPLRTMYTLNSSHSNQFVEGHPPTAPTHASSASADIASGDPSSEAHSQRLAAQTAALQLKAALMAQISQLPTQPCTMPPSFVIAFIRRCFAEELSLVDFNQSLTALDYLKDLEGRRRKEMTSALQKLDLPARPLTGEETNNLSKRYPGVVKWISGIQEREKKVESLYTQVYVGLRRWILINEMKIRPFSKANCIAMLNTLYPPMSNSSPTQQLTPVILEQQRSGFFRYIQAVEQNGTHVLTNIINQGKRRHDKNGWPVLQETIEKYLELTCSMIADCKEVTSPSIGKPLSRKASTKTDSGISFASGRRASSGNRPSTSESAKSDERSLFSPIAAVRPSGSTLERIAKEMRRIKSRGDIREVRTAKNMTIKEIRKENERTLKKMKSSSAINERGTSPSRFSREPAESLPPYNREEMVKKNKFWGPRRGKKSVG